MTGSIVFDPMLPWPILAGVAGILGTAIVLALWRGLRGWPLRLLGGLVILAALAQPAFQQEDRAPLTDIVMLLEDTSASQRLADRAEITANAADEIETTLLARGNTEVRRITVGDGEGDTGTQLMTALGTALAEEPRARVAGIIALSDGRLHDIERAPDLPAPLHLLMIGRESDWDRRLIVSNARPLPFWANPSP